MIKLRYRAGDKIKIIGNSGEATEGGKSVFTKTLNENVENKEIFVLLRIRDRCDVYRIFQHYA